MNLPRETHVQWPNAMGYPDGIRSIDEYLDYLRWFHSLGECVYRGEHQYYSTHVSPSCFRRRQEPPKYRKSSNLTTEEYVQIRLSQMRRPWLLFKFGPNRPEWVGLTQHYGGKTRLVDVTFDILIALFFGCWSFSDPPAQKDNHGWVYLFPNSALRPMSVPRDLSETRDIEQGISSSFIDMFDPSDVSPVYSQIAHLYMPKTDRLMNRRMSAQRGAFLWWHPPFGNVPRQIIPVKINGLAKAHILEELDSRGISVEVLFPDRKGRYQARKARLNTA